MKWGKCLLAANIDANFSGFVNLISLDQQVIRCIMIMIALKMIITMGFHGLPVQLFKNNLNLVMSRAPQRTLETPGWSSQLTTGRSQGASITWTPSGSWWWPAPLWAMGTCLRKLSSARSQSCSSSAVSSSIILSPISIQRLFTDVWVMEELNRR